VTAYATAGELNIAYQILGSGPADLVYVPGLVNHIEGTWDEPALARHCRRLASFSRLILFDKRGSGMSDRVAVWDKPTLEQRMDDVSAVMDAAGSERAALFATADGTPVAMLFAASYPERVTALILYAASARISTAPDYPIGLPDEVVEIILAEGKRTWGDPSSPGIDILAPSLRDNVRWRSALARMQRLAVTPPAAEAYWRMNVETDVRAVLPTISVPTLILHTSGDLMYPLAQATYVAEHIRGASLVELSGTDHLYWSQNGDAVADEIEEFLSGSRSHGDSDRVLATVLFTDIVDSTATAVGLGDRRWRDLLVSHDQMVRRQLNRYRGKEVKRTGDGFLATFDGPGRAIECACAIRDGARGLDLEIRAGLHTGEIDVGSDDIGGVAVNIAARIEAKAAPSEVLVSRTVKDLVAGSHLQLDTRGRHKLKGVSDSWELFSVAND
jgi:class 3 adenylate cyclase